MPRGNRMGPAGMGPMTGHGAGYCAGYSVPGFINPVLGQNIFMGIRRGMGLGFRGGRGGHWGTGFEAVAPVVPPFQAPFSEQQEMQSLQQQAEYLTKTLEDIKERLSELEPDSPKK
ncbi:DUF5320 domain-containing protein [bacterium]|nr:DUF5320 domain-containing protein [bacterium]